MSLRTLLPAIGLLCLFCSSAQAQTLDDTLLTVTVAFDQWSPYSITWVGLPQGDFMPLDGYYFGSYSFGPSASYVELVPFPQSEGSPCGPFYDFRGIAGPIKALGTYPMATTTSGYVPAEGSTNPFDCSIINLTGTGEIIVAAANPAPTPEPFSGSLMAMGFATLVVRRRLGRKHAR